MHLAVAAEYDSSATSRVCSERVYDAQAATHSVRIGISSCAVHRCNPFLSDGLQTSLVTVFLGRHLQVYGQCQVQRRQAPQQCDVSQFLRSMRLSASTCSAGVFVSYAMVGGIKHQQLNRLEVSQAERQRQASRRSNSSTCCVGMYM